VRRCLKEGGRFLGVVPVNELAHNPHHIHRVNENRVALWAKEAGLTLGHYREEDPFGYWIQPLFCGSGGSRLFLARMTSLTLGVPATLMGPKVWWRVGRVFARLTGSRPTQAVFALEG
jgi:hypothetical protein